MLKFISFHQRSHSCVSLKFELGLFLNVLIRLIKLIKYHILTWSILRMQSNFCFSNFNQFVCIEISYKNCLVLPIRISIEQFFPIPISSKKFTNILLYNRGVHLILSGLLPFLINPRDLICFCILYLIMKLSKNNIWKMRFPTKWK